MDERPDLSCNVCCYQGMSYEDRTLSETIQSATAGCTKCSMICTVVQSNPWSGEIDTTSWSWSIKSRGLDINSKSKTGSCELFTTTGTVLALDTVIAKLTLPATTCRWPELRPTTIPSFDTSSEIAYSTLREWIQQCTGSHEPCNDQGPQPPRLPRRVIEILGPKRIRLRETDYSTGYYTCLSCCWGSQTPVCTKEATLSKHRSSIDYDSLLKTFQDAIDIIHWSDIWYIWIDSLCIIQVGDFGWLRCSFD